MIIVYEYEMINNRLLKTNFHQVLDISQVPNKKNTWLSERFFQYPRLENDEVRESTVQELKLEKILHLDEGEYILENKILVVEKPSEFHSWDFDKNEWYLDEEKVRISKLPTKEELEESAWLFRLNESLEKLGM